MSVVCSYFKNNQCVSKYLSQMNFEGMIVPFCETENYVKCPIYIETVKREKAKDVNGGS